MTRAEPQLWRFLLQDSTIAAISTAYGEAGIGVVRISGEKALDIGKAVFEPASAKCAYGPRHMYFGHAVSGSRKRLDQVLFVYFKAPNSYTGEDVVEIQCHGSVMSLKEILDAVLAAGAEPAERGEFTKRAFLNGKLDLSQAEAVIDLIKAKSSRSFELAGSQMEGALSSEVRRIRAELLDQLVLIAVNMDYPDEDIETVSYKKLSEDLSHIDGELLKLLDSADEGRILREGISVAIVGRPNVGKSSLMNYFLKENRSIVTDIPGTTRDTIEELASLKGIQLRITDTAGIHDTEDVVESLGIERSKESFNDADLVLLLLDASSPLTQDDRQLLQLCEGRNAVVVLNKQDLEAVVAPSDVEAVLGGAKIVSCSLVSGEGLPVLEDTIINSIGSTGFSSKDILLANRRHIDLVRRADGELKQAVYMADMMEALDFIEVNVHAAFDLLGEITGDSASDELVNEIFSRFCLGK